MSQVVTSKSDCHHKQHFRSNLQEDDTFPVTPLYQGRTRTFHSA